MVPLCFLSTLQKDSWKKGKYVMSGLCLVTRFVLFTTSIRFHRVLEKKKKKKKARVL